MNARGLPAGGLKETEMIRLTAEIFLGARWVNFLFPFKAKKVCFITQFFKK
jgi:hypothetical protein